MLLTCCGLQTRLAVDGSLQSSLAVTPIHCCSTQCSDYIKGSNVYYIFRREQCGSEHNLFHTKKEKQFN